MATLTSDKIGTNVGVLMVVAVPGYAAYAFFVTTAVEPVVAQAQVVQTAGLSALEYKESGVADTYANNVYSRMNAAAGVSRNPGPVVLPAEIGSSTLQSE
jgi:hypothetical protein